MITFSLAVFFACCYFVLPYYTVNTDEYNALNLMKTIKIEIATQHLAFCEHDTHSPHT